MENQNPTPGDKPENGTQEKPAPGTPEKLETAHTEAPIAEATFPANSTPGSSSESFVPKTRHRLPHVRTMLILAIVLLLCIANFGSYFYGYNRGHSNANSVIASAEAAETSLQVPKGATIIEQCDPGKGTQYVLPSDIPHGPVYDVYNGKVIGVEYMIGKQDLANNVSYFNLPLFGKKYNHIDIGMLSQGHAGYPVPHYHVDIDMISRAASEAITCK